MKQWLFKGNYVYLSKDNSDITECVKIPENIKSVLRELCTEALEKLTKEFEQL